MTTKEEKNEQLMDDTETVIKVKKETKKDKEDKKDKEILELKKQIKKLTEERDEINAEYSSYVENEDIQTEKKVKEAVEAAVDKIKQENWVTKKEFWEGGFAAFREAMQNGDAVKGWITKEEIADWALCALCDAGDVIKKIFKPEKTIITVQTKTSQNDKPRKEGTCNAMIYQGGGNAGATCCRDGFGKWGYCKIHTTMFNKGRTWGDKRQQMTYWEDEVQWKEELNENK